MSAIVQHPIDPSTTAQHQSMLRTLHVADLTDLDADRLWDQATSALVIPTAHLQHEKRSAIISNIHQATGLEVGLCSQ